MHPELEQRGSFEHLPLGRKPAVHDERTLMFASYVDDAVVLPEIPAAADYAAAVPAWPMYCNDRFGDCTCAAVGHMVQAWSAAAGREVTVTDDDVLALYWQTGHPAGEPCDPGGATDDGRVELGVLNYWRNEGLRTGDRIEAYVSVDPRNHDHVRAAIYLFGGVYTGIALPKTAQGQNVWDVVGDGKTGDSEPFSWGGHAVPYLAYTEAGDFVCITWGEGVRLTGAFHEAYTDECYAVISPDFLVDGKTPAGFDLEALKTDLEAIRAR